MTLARHRQRAYPKHVVHRQAVLEAVHAAGVFGDVAADRAGDLARRVGRVVQPMRGARLRKWPDCARPAARVAVRAAGIEREDAIEFRHRQQHAAGDAVVRCPTRPVPAPRGTTGTRCSWQILSTCATCASVSGSTTTIGSWR